MALKNYRIHYRRVCTTGTYDHHEDVRAVSEKMAIKKFWNHKDFNNGRSNLDWMKYEREALGFQWIDVHAELISD